MVTLVQSQLARLACLARSADGNDGSDATEADCAAVNSRCGDEAKVGGTHIAPSTTISIADDDNSDGMLCSKQAQTSPITTSTTPSLTTIVVASTNTDNTSPAAADPRSSEVAVLLSGGVDSSVALQLLVAQGVAVRAYYLKIWLEDDAAHLGERCPWEEDLYYAQKGERV